MNTSPQPPSRTSAYGKFTAKAVIKEEPDIKMSGSVAVEVTAVAESRMIWCEHNTRTGQGRAGKRGIQRAANAEQSFREYVIMLSFVFPRTPFFSPPFVLRILSSPPSFSPFCFPLPGRCFLALALHAESTDQVASLVEAGRTSEALALLRTALAALNRVAPNRPGWDGRTLGTPNDLFY